LSPAARWKIKAFARRSLVEPEMPGRRTAAHDGFSQAISLTFASV
jgi:ribosomal protein S19